MLLGRTDPTIPIGALPEDCWVQNLPHRPLFAWILSRLKKIDFSVATGVNSAKARRLASAIERRQRFDNSENYVEFHVHPFPSDIVEGREPEAEKWADLKALDFARFSCVSISGHTLKRNG